MGWTILQNLQTPFHKRSKECFRGEGDDRYINPDPLYHLVGPANEIESIIDGVKLGNFS